MDAALEVTIVYINAKIGAILGPNGDAEYVLDQLSTYKGLKDAAAWKAKVKGRNNLNGSSPILSIFKDKYNKKPKLEGGKYAEKQLTNTKAKKDKDLEIARFTDSELESKRVVSNSNGEMLWAKDGTIVNVANRIYVMDKDGNMYIHDGPSGNMNLGDVQHSSMSNHGVVGAGQITVENGIIVLVDRSSGHYTPGPSSSILVKSELTSQGFEIDSADIKKGF